MSWGIFVEMRFFYGVLVISGLRLFNEIEEDMKFLRFKLFINEFVCS